MIFAESIQVSPKAITLKKDEWYFNACVDISPVYADIQDVIWESDNPSVASVNASNGFIQANAEGIAKIYATVMDENAYRDFITVTVVPSEVKKSSDKAEKGKLNEYK